MPIIFNWIGAGMGAISLLVGILVAFQLLSSAPEKTQMSVLSLVSGSMAVAMDVGYRMKWGGGHLFLPDAGGNIFFIPIWICGIIFALLLLFNNK